EPPVALGDVGEDGGAVLGVVCAPGDGGCRGAERLDRLIERLLAPRRDDDRAALGDDPLRDREADAAARARHERDGALEAAAGLGAGLGCCGHGASSRSTYRLVGFYRSTLLVAPSCSESQEHLVPARRVLRPEARDTPPTHQT